MKKLLLIPTILLLVFSCKPNKESILEKFEKNLTEGKIIKYDLIFEFKDVSRGTTIDTAALTLQIAPHDSLLGEYFNLIENNGSRHVYNGKELWLYYVPENYGPKTVFYSNKERNPGDFRDNIVKMNGQEFTAPAEATNSLYLENSPVKLLNTLKIYSKKYSCKISDTTINKIKCNKLYYSWTDSLDGKQYQCSFTAAFDKGSGMPVLVDDYNPIQEVVFFYSNYDLNLNGRKDLFSAAAFPPNFKIVEQAERVEAPHLTIDDDVPEWSAKSLEGKELSLKQFTNSPILLIFSEIGCVPCQLSVPNLNKFHEKYPKLNMIGIYPVDSGDFLKKYISSKKIMYPIIPGAKDIGKEYMVDAYPTFFLIRRNGKLNKIISGYSDDQFNDFCKEIDKIIAK